MAREFMPWWSSGLDLGPPPYNTRGSRDYRRDRRDDLSAIRPMPQVQYAEKVASGQQFDAFSDLDRECPQKVTLVGLWSGSSGNFPAGLIGRIVEEVDGRVHVWFRNRGIFAFPAAAILREASFPHPPARREDPPRRYRPRLW